MLWIFIVIGLIVTFLGMFFYDRMPTDSGDAMMVMVGILGVVIAAVSLSLAIVGVCFIEDARYLDDKIALYEEENARIEANISSCVEAYKTYEQSTFSSITQTTTDPSVLVQLYPELKSDTLVQKQIDVYISNNASIKALKEKKISVKPWKRWLFFAD